MNVVNDAENKVDYERGSDTYTLIVAGLDFSITKGKDVDVLAQFTKAMQYADSIGEDKFLDRLEDWAGELAEDFGCCFVYNRKGKKREYSPASMWEPSDGCEWEQSAEYGINYGWNIW